eukprot:3325149-Rhodomonas_salina.3
MELAFCRPSMPPGTLKHADGAAVERRATQSTAVRILQQGGGQRGDEFCVCTEEPFGCTSVPHKSTRYRDLMSMSIAANVRKPNTNGAGTVQVNIM